MAFLSPLLAVCLAGGIGAGVLLERSPALVLSLTVSGAWTVSLLAWLRGYPRHQVVAVCVLVVGAGWLHGAAAVERSQHAPIRKVFDELAAESLVVEGRLRGDADVSAAGITLRIDVERVALDGAWRAAPGGIAVGVAGQPARAAIDEWTAGRRVRAPVLLRRPARYLNQGLADQERTQAMRGVSLVGTIKSAALIEVIARGRWWEEQGAAVRARTRRALAQHVLPLDAQASVIATAILVGDRGALAPEIEQRLQEAGTYHVIAISGGNIAILAGLWVAVLGAAGLRGNARWLIVIALLAAYTVIADGGASVIRASCMAIVYLAVRLIDQRTAPANAIAITAGGVLLAQPLAIVDVGFWLTFGATAALMVMQWWATGADEDGAEFASGIRAILPGDGGWVGQGRSSARGGAAMRARTSIGSRLRQQVRTILLGVVLATGAVELALAPVAAYVFERVTIAGLALNVVALPAMTVVQVAAMGVVGADLLGLSTFAAPCGRVVAAAAWGLTESARLTDVAPWLTWRVPPPVPAVLGLYYGLAFLALAAMVRSWPLGVKRFAVVSAGVCLLWIVAAPAARIRARGDGRLHLTLIDVGQGDAMLVTFPNGRTLLIDAGGASPGSSFDVGERVVGPSLRARGLLSLDYLAVTHGDPDHVGGAAALVRDFAPREVWWGVPVNAHLPTERLRALAWRARAAWRTLQRLDRLEIGGVEVRVLHPPVPDWERQRVRNDDSLVIELRFGEVSMLLTGDIGRDVERALVPTLDVLPLLVLKVAHHGSATSSIADFVAAARPRIALIGVGRGNPYGHPVPAVLERLRDAGAAVYRTDLDGQVNLVTDGRQLEVTTFVPRAAGDDAGR